MFKNAVLWGQWLARFIHSQFYLLPTSVVTVLMLQLPANAQTLGAVKVMAGERSNCVQTAGGGLKCWGKNAVIDGNLTILGTTNTAPFVLLPSDVVGASTNIVKSAFNGVNQCVITAAGVVQCRLPNLVGTNFGSNGTNFTPIPTLNGATDIAVGQAHLCARTANGAMACWGNNRVGQLAAGVPDVNFNVFAPAEVATLGSGVAAISVGDQHSCALTTAGAVKCWGYSESGQAGARDRFSFSHANPDVILGMETGMVAVVAGPRSTCAVSNAGALKCTGAGGIATTVIASGVSSVAVGGGHSCVVTTAGGVKCWGFNSKGQLGNGIASVSIDNTPVDVVGLSSGVVSVAVSAAGEHTCAVLATGAVKCWGFNGDGEFGNGTTLNSAVPVDVSSPPPPAPIAQTITFSAPFIGNTTSFVAQGIVAVSATASSNLAVTFSSSTPSICSVSGSSVTMLTLGTCTVVANQAGNAAFTAAPPVSQSFAIVAPPPASSPPTTPQSLSTIAGTAGVLGGGVVNDVALTGRTFNTGNVITDRDGNIFFTNVGGLIYCISARTGRLFTIGGIGSATAGTNGFSGDGGLATLAAFNNPTGLIFGPDGHLYIADTGNNRVRRINSVTGVVTTIAGGGSLNTDNIQGITALLSAPRSLAFGADGLLYIADGSNRIRRLNIATGVLSFFAGTGVAGYGGDNGAALAAVFSDIYYITFDFQGNLFLVDRGNNRIRCITRAGIVLPVAGTGAVGFGGDGGLALNALFSDIRALAFDFWGQLYIVDGGNNRIRRLNLLTGLISTYSVGGNSTFNAFGINFDTLGSLITAELGLLRTVRFIDNPGFALSFPTRARIAAGTTALSDVRNFTGFTGQVSLSIDGGEYNIGCNAANAFVSGITSLTISNPPQTVCLRVTAGLAAGDARTANFRINNTSSPFTVLTLDPDLLPRYRIYVPSLRRHLYTTDTNEYNVLVGFSATYSGEGISHYLYRAPVSRAAQAAIPYYRMYFNPQRRHFYTSDFNEYDTIRKDKVFASDEGITGYIFPRYGVPGTTPLYRLYNAGINSHLWTIDSNEFNFLRNNGWTAEGQLGNAAGVDGYVFP